MAEIHALGPCTFEFKMLDTVGAEPLVITHTDEEADTNITSEVTIFEIMADQALGPVYSKLANVTAVLNASIFLDYEKLAELTAEWTKGATGFALGNVGAVQPIFELIVKPLGKTEAKDWLVMPYCRVKSDTSIGLKKEGKALAALTVTGSSDERKTEKTFGMVITTGDFNKLSA
ncbi:MAG: hypothetical protein ACRC0F_01785 [Cetobacterium sp.]